MNKPFVSIETDSGIGVITIENPPVNAMSPGVPQAIMGALNAMADNPEIKVVVLVGGGKGNIAGADIRFQGKDWPAGEPTLRDLIDALEQSPKPVVAALGPNTLGGGLEIAMACHYRVIQPGGKVGQPEVTLGIPPGAGGTQRLPRLASVEVALEMIVSGKPVSAEIALDAGIVDRVIPAPFMLGAKAFAREVGQQPEHVPTRQRPLPEIAESVFAAARQSARKKYRGQHAPQICIDCVEAAFRLPFDEALVFERSQFEACVVSDEAAALRHVFFAERQAGRFVAQNDQPVPEVRSIAVIGAGTMGSGIAIALLKAGYRVDLVDTAKESLSKGVARIESTLDADVKKGRLDADARERLRDQFCSFDQLESLADVQLVIEAVFEDMEVKKKIFGKLAQLCPDAVLASNTSYLDIDAIAGAAGDSRTNVVGMHFFSPANIMRLLEVVRGAHSADIALQVALAVGKRAGKTAIIAGNCHGFVGNRLYACYQREAHFLIEEGTLPVQVDAALTNFGFAMGPFAVADLAGLDIGWANRKAQSATRDPARRYSVVADRICEKGWFGQKTGIGFYRYETGSRQGLENPAVTDIILQASADLGIKRRQIDDSEIVSRCVWAIVNEGARVIEEGIANGSGDIDLAWIYGYGFPRWRGGPMHFAGTTGLATVLAEIGKFNEAHDFWQPAALLGDLVAAGKTAFP